MGFCHYADLLCLARILSNCLSGTGNRNENENEEENEKERDRTNEQADDRFESNTLCPPPVGQNCERDMDISYVE